MKNFFPIQKSGVEPFSILAAALSPKYNCPQILIVVDCRSTKVFHGEHFSAEIPAIPVFYSLSTDCGRRFVPGQLLTIQMARSGPGPEVCWLLNPIAAHSANRVYAAFATYAGPTFPLVIRSPVLASFQTICVSLLTQRRHRLFPPTFGVLLPMRT